MSLHVTIRVCDNQQNFSDWLLNVGDGKVQNLFEKLFLNLIDEIYRFSINPNDKAVYSYCILSPTNSEVLNINESILSKLEGDEIIYNSVDTHHDEDSAQAKNLIPVEFLNSLTPDGLPLHMLCLKIGAVIMLLRNMNLAQGLCNGTRLVVSSLIKNIICAEIITGKFIGEKVLIPRIDLSPSPDAFPFKMVRRQFPDLLILCY